MKIAKDFGEVSDTGTTTATDAVALDLDTRSADCVCILLKATGASPVTYTINSYAKYDGDLYNTETSATSLAAAATVQKIYSAKYFARLKVLVKATQISAGAGADTYQIEAIQKGGGA